MSKKMKKPVPVKSRPVKSVGSARKSAKSAVSAKSESSLEAVERAEPTFSRDAPKQWTVTESKFWFLDVTGIAGLADGELATVLRREGVQESYATWREAKAVAPRLSGVGGIRTVTIVGRRVKSSESRGETWENERCVSMDGGVTKLVKPEKETE